MSGKEGLIENSSILLAGLCTLDVPVFLTQQYTRGLGTTVKEIREAARTEEFVEKIRFSAYEDVLKECPSIQEKKYIILCGIEAHICVLQTLIDLRAHGYIPVLVTDCILFLCKISFTSVKTKQKKRIFVLKERKLYYGNT